MKHVWLVLLAVLLVSGLALAEENLATYAFITVESTFSSYTHASLTNGERNYGSEVNRWNDAAWASMESANDHWIEADLGFDADVHRIEIWWARDTGKFWWSKHIVIEAMINGYFEVIYDSAEDASKFPLFVARRDETGDAEGTSATILEFKSFKTDTIRVIQPSGGGNPARPNLMWVAELEIWGR